MAKKTRNGKPLPPVLDRELLPEELKQIFDQLRTKVLPWIEARRERTRRLMQDPEIRKQLAHLKVPLDLANSPEAFVKLLEEICIAMQMVNNRASN